MNINAARRARLRPVLSAEGETAAILNVLQQRRRNARRRRLRVVLSPESENETFMRVFQRQRIARIAAERRQAQRAMDARWIDVDRAIEIAVEEGVADAADHLRVAVKQGLLCRFHHRDRWWLSKPVEEVAPPLAGRHPLDLEDKYWKLVVHERFWRDYLARLWPVEPAPEKSAPVERPVAVAPPDQTLPPPKTRATKRTTIEEYTAFQNDYLEKYKTYASKDAEEAWARAKGCSPRHVRDVLRPEYRDSLPAAEQAKFQSHAKKPRSPVAPAPDDGPRDDRR